MKESVSDAGAEDVTLLTKLSLSAFCGEEVVVRTKIKSRGIKSWDESWCCSSPIDQVTRSVSSEYIRAAGSQSTTPQLIKCECAVVRELLVWIPEPAGKIYIERESERMHHCCQQSSETKARRSADMFMCEKWFKKKIFLCMDGVEEVAVCVRGQCLPSGSCMRSWNESEIKDRTNAGHR